MMNIAQASPQNVGNENISYMDGAEHLINGLNHAVSLVGTDIKETTQACRIFTESLEKQQVL